VALGKTCGICGFLSPEARLWTIKNPGKINLFSAHDRILTRAPLLAHNLASGLRPQPHIPRRAIAGTATRLGSGMPSKSGAHSYILIFVAHFSVAGIVTVTLTCRTGITYISYLLPNFARILNRSVVIVIMPVHSPKFSLTVRNEIIKTTMIRDEANSDITICNGSGISNPSWK
jgi:hypothetical protein